MLKSRQGTSRTYSLLGCDVDFDMAGPSIPGALVLGYEGWLAGYQMNFETANLSDSERLYRCYKTSEFQLHTNV